MHRPGWRRSDDLTLGTLSRAPLCCAVIAVAALLVAGCGPSVAGSGPTASGAAGTIAAETYCTDKGGALVDRVATWNTNGDPSTWLELAGRLRLCEFEDGSGDFDHQDLGRSHDTIE